MEATLPNMLAVYLCLIRFRFHYEREATRVWVKLPRNPYRHLGVKARFVEVWTILGVQIEVETQRLQIHVGWGKRQSGAACLRELRYSLRVQAVEELMRFLRDQVAPAFQVVHIYGFTPWGLVLLEEGLES